LATEEFAQLARVNPTSIKIGRIFRCWEKFLYEDEAGERNSAEDFSSTRPTTDGFAGAMGLECD
jgi:hypothetical protein